MQSIHDVETAQYGESVSQSVMRFFFPVALTS